MVILSLDDVSHIGYELDVIIVTLPGPKRLIFIVCPTIELSGVGSASVIGELP